MSRSKDKPWWLPPSGRIGPAWWVAIGAAMCWIDYRTDFFVQFPVVYVIPVSLAAWYSGRRIALSFAIVAPLAHVVFSLLRRQPGDPATLVAATAFRGVVIVFMALWFARLSEHERQLAREVQVLQGLLPICSFCKSIRNESGEWEKLEMFISRRSATQFSHGLCPSCQKTHYPELT